MHKIVIVLVVLLQLQGCGILRDRRDAPWDPRDSSRLFEQIPNNEGQANITCGGHLTPEEQVRLKRSPRC